MKIFFVLIAIFVFQIDNASAQNRRLTRVQGCTFIAPLCGTFVRDGTGDSYFIDPRRVGTPSGGVYIQAWGSVAPSNPGICFGSKTLKPTYIGMLKLC